MSRFLAIMFELGMLENQSKAQKIRITA